jgi:hypothetical protein
MSQQSHSSSRCNGNATTVAADVELLQQLLRVQHQLQQLL